jgi:hypothetical protein
MDTEETDRADKNRREADKANWMVDRMMAKVGSPEILLDVACPKESGCGNESAGLAKDLYERLARDFDPDNITCYRDTAVLWGVVRALSSYQLMTMGDRLIVALLDHFKNRVAASFYPGSYNHKALDHYLRKVWVMETTMSRFSDLIYASNRAFEDWTSWTAMKAYAHGILSDVALSALGLTPIVKGGARLKKHGRYRIEI